jgi:hypothetical protein
LLLQEGVVWALSCFPIIGRHTVHSYTILRRGQRAHGASSTAVAVCVCVRVCVCVCMCVYVCVCVSESV